MKACASPGGCRLALLSLSLLLPVPPAVTPHPRPRPPAARSFEPRSSSFVVSSSRPSSRQTWGQPQLEAALRTRPPPPPPLRRAREDGAQGGAGGSRTGEALTSILGGLQTAGREKGGFGFRFGRNSAVRGG
ncbi:uncharacterized protein qrfp isoform X2 [Corythoichthys intestinalis]|nr:uncharacterized protein qrfp isoform X2 [Corythoichthys intestinalis]